MPFESTLAAIVKGLKDPILLFGLGAGILVVGALTLTKSVALVLIVAGVLIAALLGRLIGNVQARRGGGIFARVFAFGTKFENSDVANVDAAPGSQVRTTGTFIGTHVTGSRIGVVSGQGTTPEEDRKHGGDRSSEP